MVIESLAYTGKIISYTSDPYKSMAKIKYLCIVYNSFKCIFPFLWYYVDGLNHINVF